MATPASLPEEAAALFREPPETFIAARNALAARLADAGDAEGSRAVKALRKPTVVAWALDQVAERDPDGVRALLDAGAELRAAQQAALSSRRGATDRLQEAGATRKEAVARLARVAEDALSDGGRSAGAHTDAIVQALEICSVDPDSGAALAAGVLERPPERAAGFGELFGLTSLEGGLEQPSETRPRSAGSGRAGRADRRAEAARLRRDRDAVARRARKARESAEGFARELDGMRRRLEVVEGKHATAEANASELELELARAERALRRADEDLDED
ncbi:MAG TPA: hypothetical protein VIC52_02825 [Actinomycetota bacterium]|jgi:hypothetical protein